MENTKTQTNKGIPWEKARELAVRQVLGRLKTNTEDLIEGTIEKMGPDLFKNPNVDLPGLIALGRNTIKQVRASRSKRKAPATRNWSI